MEWYFILFYLLLFLLLLGKGVVRNYGGAPGPTMPELFLNEVANFPQFEWDFTRFTPHVVVSFLGCNDFSTTPVPSYANFSAGERIF